MFENKEAIVDPKIDRYAAAHSAAEKPLFKKLVAETKRKTRRPKACRRVEVLMLPIRDGITVAVKSSS